MASLVSEILMSAGQLEKRDLQSEIDKINQKVEDAKFGVAKFLEQHYSEFNPLLVHSRELAETSGCLKEAVEQLIVKAETELKFQLDSSTTELNTIAGQIEAAKLQAGLLERVAQLHTLLEGLKKIDMESDVVRYSQVVAEAGKILGQAEGGIETELDIWGPVKFEVERCKDQLVKFLEDSWNGHVQWMSKSDQGEPVKVKLYVDAGKLKDTFIALASIDQLDRLLCEWSTRFLEEVLGPLMKADSVIQFEQDHFEVLGGEQNVVELRQLEGVLVNFSSLFQYLNEQLGFEVSDTRVLRMIGAQIADQFAQSFIKVCLKATLPATSALLSSPEYHSALEAITVFEGQLLDTDFLTERLMSEFAANVDVYFADKVSLESLTRARALMCRDLHDTFLLTPNEQDETVFTGPDEAANETTAHLWKMLGEGGMEVKWSPFRFPPCLVSRSAQELVELLTDLVREAGLSSTSERCIARLLFTVRSIVELFVSVLPEYHRDHLEKLPFHAAVAHNNCMFLAHSILRLGTGHLIKLPHQNGVPLMDLVGKCRTLAAQIFLDHLRRQRDQLTATFKEAGFNRLSEGESHLPPSAEKASKQCLVQLRNLQKIWQPALPEEVYLRALGTLSNVLLEELLIRITAMEDIPTDAALQLADQCQTVANSLPALFGSVDESEGLNNSSDKLTGRAYIGLVQQHVHFWPRFGELRHLLSANLRDIEDRWASGKGPLATHFTADEVKQMIRALFQNTDHRAATLSRIK